MIKISIIVPLYNVEEYLSKCIETLINQTLKEIEIILIDDGSTDKSSKICDEYAKRDSRIRVIHQKNVGVSQARNNAIQIASGEFVMFVDGDDWIEEQTCEIAYNTAVEKKADALMFDYISESSRRG